MNQNTKAKTIWQAVPKTKTLHHESVSTELTENITQHPPKIDPCNNNSKTHEAINETTKKISIASDLIANVIGKIEYKLQQIHNTYNVKIYVKFPKRNIQDIKVTGNEHQVSMSLNEMNNIVSCANYLNKICYYGRHCKLLHYSFHPKVISNQQATHNKPNQNKIHLRKQQ